MTLYAELTLSVLDQRDNVVIILDEMKDGGSPDIVSVNLAFSRVTGFTAAEVCGRPLSLLRGDATDPAVWSDLLQAIAVGRRLDADLLLNAQRAAPFWLGFGLHHPRDPANGHCRPVIFGRDITAARRRTAEESDMQRLLASVFLKIDAGVVVVRHDGAIMIGNPAFHHMLGFDAGEATGMHVDRLTPPEDRAALAELRARQIDEGGSYQRRMRTLRKDGVAIWVVLTSVAVTHITGQRLRVVTLIPAAPAVAPPSQPKPQIARSPVAPVGMVGSVYAVNLDALKLSFAADWERIANRAMLLAEQVIKGRLGPDDVFSRADEQGFVIWFGTGDSATGAAAGTAIAREIRIRLLCEFGDGAASHVCAITVEPEAPAPPPAQGAAPEAAIMARLNTQFATQRRRAELAGRRLLEAAIAAPAELTGVIDRDLRAVKMAIVEPPASISGPLLEAIAAGTVSPEDAETFDLICLGLAAQAAQDDSERRQQRELLVSVSCAALLSSRRRAAYLNALGALTADQSRRLTPLITDISADFRTDRLNEPLRLLRGCVSRVGLRVKMTELAALPPTSLPNSVMVIDAAGVRGASAADAFTLVAAARQRGASVLVCLSDPAAIVDWREIGANLFALPAAG